MIENQINKNNWKKSFYIIVIGQSISIIGSGAVQFSLIWWLTNKFESANVLSLAAFLMFMPQAILGPFVGVWVDRLKRKNIIIASDLFVGLVAMFLALYSYFKVPSLLYICCALGLRSLGGAFQTPAVQSTISLLVPKNELIRVNSINQFLQTGSNLLSPIIGAVMLSILPLYLVLLTDLFGAIIASALIIITKIPELKNVEHGKRNFLLELKEGIGCFISDKALGRHTFILFLCTILYMPLGILFPLMIKENFNGKGLHAGMAQSIYTLGMLLAALIIGILSKKLKIV